METLSFSSLEESGKVDIFNEYAQKPFCVLSTIDDLDEVTKTNYKKITLSNRSVFVRSDVVDEIDKRIDSGVAFSKKMSTIHGPSLFHGVHKVLRPFLKSAYESRDKAREIVEKKKREEMREVLIKNKEAEEIKRIEIAQFVASFPPNVQKSLKEGAFLIESEGRYYQTVEEGADSFAGATTDSKFESKKAGNWKKGLFQVIKAGSPYVKSFIPSNISGVISRFKAELENDNVKTVVTGDSFSTFGDNELLVRIKFMENGEEKEISHSFTPF